MKTTVLTSLFPVSAVASEGALIGHWCERCVALSCDSAEIYQHKDQQLNLSRCHLLAVCLRCPFSSWAILVSRKSLMWLPKLPD